MPDEERDEEIPRASKTTMPPPPGEPTETPIQREFGKVAPDIPEDVTGPVRRERPPWPVEEPIVPEQEALEPGGNPAMRARKFGDRGSDKSEVLGEQFAEDQ